MPHPEFRYASHPVDARSYGREKLRTHFLSENLFFEDSTNLIYSMYNCNIAGGPCR